MIAERPAETPKNRFWTNLDSLLPARPTAEGDREEEDDRGKAGGNSKEQVLDKLGPGLQLLNVNVNLASLFADRLLDEVDVGIVNVDENDSSDLEEEDDEDTDAVEGEEALVLFFWLHNSQREPQGG